MLELSGGQSWSRITQTTIFSFGMRSKCRPVMLWQLWRWSGGVHNSHWGSSERLVAARGIDDPGAHTDFDAPSSPLPVNEVFVKPHFLLHAGKQKVPVGCKLSFTKQASMEFQEDETKHGRRREASLQTRVRRDPGSRDKWFFTKPLQSAFKLATTIVFGRRVLNPKGSRKLGLKRSSGLPLYMHLAENELISWPDVDDFSMFSFPCASL